MAKKKKSNVQVIRLTSLRSPKNVVNKLATPRRIKFMIILAGILLLSSSVLWYQMIYTSPKRVFQRMLDNSLGMTSISRNLNQSDANQSMQESSMLSSFGEHVARSVSAINQKDAGSKVVTESFGTPIADYARYLQLETSQKGANNQPLDFSKIIGVWGKTDVEDSTQTNGQLFSELTLGIIPMGNLNQSDRQELINQINSSGVYEIDYSKGVTRKTIDGHPAYVYSVKVKPEPYVKLLKDFAHKMGLTQLEQVNPSVYSQTQPIEFDIAVDIRAAALKSVSYKSNDRVEEFTSQGVINIAKEPTDAVSINELQSRLQTVQ